MVVGEGVVPNFTVIPGVKETSGDTRLLGRPLSPYLSTLSVGRDGFR